MMIPSFPEFIPLTLKHSAEYNTRSKEMNLHNADLSFPELFVWQEMYKPFISRFEDSFCVKLEFSKKKMLFPPIGKLPFHKVKDVYIQYFHDKYGKGLIGGLSKKEAELTGYPYTFDRDNSDYVYTVTDLAELPGTKYHPKRNLVRQFNKNYPYEFKPLDCSTIEGCLKLSEDWCNIKECSGNPRLHAEERAVKEMLTHCHALHLFGGVITVQGKIAAFTVASELNTSTVVIHIEKADTRYKGIYQAINNLFAGSLKGKYEWLNRESDIGNEGLRKAKLSYYPHHLVEKYYIKV